MKARGQKYNNASHGEKDRVIDNFSEAKIPKVSSSNHIIGGSGNNSSKVMANN